MAGHSIPIDFWVDPEKINCENGRENILQNVLLVVQPFFEPLKKVSDVSLPGGDFVYLFASEKTSLSAKIYKRGLISLSVEYFVEEDAVNKPKIFLDDGRHIEEQLKSKIGSKRVKVLPALKRAPPKNSYFLTSDERLLEYDINEVLFDDKSNFQKVQIYSTHSFGNILFLDDQQNLGESDLAYTQSLMNKENEDFKGKEILILGGGDGALLWELLKEDPGFVTMIDIDEMVMEACRSHMKSVCGNCLDNYDGENYKIIVDDAIKYMRKYLEAGRKFDYIFGDLTDIPISETPHGGLWDFMREIMNLAVQLLKPSGKYMTHAIGIQCKAALQMFEHQINNLVLPVTYTRTNCHVPSFMENWCFYQLSLKGR